MIPGKILYEAMRSIDKILIKKHDYHNQAQPVGSVIEGILSLRG
jgi:hypothetical protein